MGYCGIAISLYVWFRSQYLSSVIASDGIGSLPVLSSTHFKVHVNLVGAGTGW